MVEELTKSCLIQGGIFCLTMIRLQNEILKLQFELLKITKAQRYDSLGFLNTF